MQNILLTGFEPFGGLNDNPSARVVDNVDGLEIGRYKVVARTLPVTFVDAPQRIEQLIAEYEPELVVSLGLAGGEGSIRLERRALNHVDFRISDNAGQCVQGPVCDGGAESYLSNLPLELIRDALQRNDIPVRLSDSAGTFVCNALMYSALNICSQQDRDTMCGFIHLPYLPEQVAGLQNSGIKENPLVDAGTYGSSNDSVHSMPLTMQIKAVGLALEICTDNL